MGNIQSLLTQIDNLIYENHNNEITGSNTNVILKAIANTLNAMKVDAEAGKVLSANDFTDILKSKLDALPTNAELDAALDGKVDKVAGKGLSQNDLTNALLASINSAVQPGTMESAIATALANYVANSRVVQTSGSDQAKIMSQKAVTDMFDLYVSIAEHAKVELVDASALQSLASRLEALEKAYSNVLRENIAVNYLNVGKELNVGGNRIVLDENGDITVIGNLHVTGQIVNP